MTSSWTDQKLPETTDEISWDRVALQEITGLRITHISFASILDENDCAINKYINGTPLYTQSVHVVHSLVDLVYVLLAHHDRLGIQWN